jgi:hypothetical protein
MAPLGLLGPNWVEEFRNAAQKHKLKPSQDSPEKYNLRIVFRGPTHGVKLTCHSVAMRKALSQEFEKQAG